MTASPDSNMQKPLRVVIPQARTPGKPSQPKPSTQPSAKTEPLTQEPTDADSQTNHGWLRWILIGTGLTMAAFIPTPYWVGGEVTLEWTEGQRQAIYTPRRAIVKDIHVEAGQMVPAGAPLITLQSLELDSEIADTEEKLAQAYAALERLQAQQVELDTRVNEAQLAAQAAHIQANRLRDRVSQMETDALPPEIATLVARANRLEARLTEVQQDIDSNQQLFDAGAVSEKVVRDAKSLYQNVQSDLTVTHEEIALAKRQLEDSATDLTENALYKQEIQVSTQRLLDVNAGMQAYQQAIQTLENRLDQLSNQQGELVINANLAGRVLGEDLDLIAGQEVDANQVILRVVNLKQLTAEVDVKEDDLSYVNVGAPVKFRSQQSKLDVHDAQIEKIPSYDVESDETNQKRIVKVEISIENEEELLRPGSSGYAKIFSEWIPLYERLGREISKLVPIRFL